MSQFHDGYFETGKNMVYTHYCILDQINWLIYHIGPMIHSRALLLAIAYIYSTRNN